MKIEVDKSRIEAMLEVVFQVSQGNYSKTLEITKKNDEFDSLAMGINLMLEELKYNIKEIEIEKEKAESANKSKSTFFANLSHEIRTPLNAIIGYTELLRDNTIDVNLKNYCNNILLGSDHLQNLINDILNLSKIEAGKFDIHLHPFSIKNLLNEVYEIFKVSAKQKNINFKIEYLSICSSYIISDEVRVRQILLNLVGNAIKFTSAGGHVTVKVNCIKRNTDDYTLVIAISDTGIGVAPNQLDTIFDAFKQQEGQNAQYYGGTGLGLTIASRLAHLLGGFISLKSEINTGSEFTIILNNLKVPPNNEILSPVTELSVDQNYFFKRQKVLIIDDNDLNRQMLRHTLINFNIDAHVVIGGKEALEYLSENNVNLILLDIMMPEMNGYETLAEIRKIHKLVNVPVIAITAVATEINTTGFYKVLNKPIVRTELLETLALLLERTEKTENAAVNVEVLHESVVQHKPKILIVDDLSLNLKVQALLFSKNNFEVLIANNALHGLLLAEEKQPHLILSDIMMPEVDGFEFCTKLKSNTSTKHIPVFFLSADTSESTINRAFEVGGCDYLSKPYNESEILLKIKKHLPIVFKSKVPLSTNLKIAVVDDNSLNRGLLNDYLKKDGFIPYLFDEAAALFASKELDQFGAILLDIEMPVVNGWEALEILQTKNFNKPIIAVSAHSDVEFIEKCIKKGFNDVLTKPVKKSTLSNILIKHLNPTNRTIESDLILDDQIIDLTKFLKITQTDLDYRITAHQEFVVLVDHIVILIEESIEKKQYEQTLPNQLHSLKNMANFFCKKSAVTTIKMLEQKMKGQLDFEEKEAEELLFLMNKIKIQLKDKRNSIN